MIRFFRDAQVTRCFSGVQPRQPVLIKEVIYKSGFPMEPEEIVFRILLFKLFNTVAAWEVLLQSFGTPTWAEFNQNAYAKALGDAWDNGKSVAIWNAAYVQNQKYRTDLPTKHERYLALVKYMMDDRVADRLQGPRTCEQAFRLLQGYPLHGKSFLPDAAFDGSELQPGYKLR